MSIREFYDNLKNNKGKKTELNELYSKPKPETGTEMPRAQVFAKNTYYQADTLYMPDDDGYKFILVCVDMYDSRIDAEPMKEVDSTNAIKAFKEIFKRNILEYPVLITLDRGLEFKNNDMVNYFKQKGTNIKYALTARSRQVANAERANQRIVEVLFARMANQELITGEVDKHWVKDLKELVQVLNEHTRKPLEKEISPLPLVDKFNGKLLTIGTKVRVLLDYPINTVNNARISGKFRSSDIRWSTETYKITEVLLKPGQPPMYLTDKDDMIGRTKNQLQKVSKDTIEPDAKFIRGTPEHYIIAEILGKKVENRKTYYLTRWRGFSKEEATFEPAETFDRTKDLRKMKKAFNSKV